MTMLDRMRRHKNWLKWSLALVVLTFVVFYIPDFLNIQTGAAPNDVVAEVEGTPITVAAFQRRYLAQLSAYRTAYGGQINEQLLKQLGIDRQILQQLVDEEAMVAEARRQGITVGNEEVRARIVAMPGFQENGRFVGEQRYRQILQFQNPPLTTREFEESLRRALAIDKLRLTLTGWMTVGDDEVGAEYHRRNDKVKVDVVSVTAEPFRSQVTVTDQEVADYFEKRKENYRIGEKRKIEYFEVEVDKLRGTVTVPDAEIAAFYEQNRQQYTTPAQVRASHILFHTEGKDENEVRKLAEEVLKRAKAPGADFAALAKQYSEDEASKANGGDLDYFGRGRMVPEFEAVAFSLKPGEIGDLVKTSFGFHIIKVVDSKPEATRPLADVRAEIEDQLRWQKAQQDTERLVRSLEPSIKTPADLKRVAKERGYDVRETRPFLADEPIDGIGQQPEIAARVFAMKDGEVTSALRIATGWVFATLTGRQDAYVPKLEEVATKVRDDLTREKAEERSRTRAAALAGELKSASDFAGAVRRAGLEVKTSDLVTRGTALPDVGISDDVESAAFSLPIGGVSDPISTPTGTAIIRVVERVAASDAELAAGRDALREELVNQRRDRFFSAYMQKAKQGLTINVRQDTLARVVGS
jgi:peptidyl-prolyl cis-trans isomerase D